MKPLNKMMKLVPPFGVIRKYYDRIYDFQFNKEMDKQAKRLAKIKDIHTGKCFVIGNGPSIKKTKLDLIRGHYCFGVNRFFEHSFSKYCQYWAVQDSRVFNDYHREILGLDKVVFLGGSRLVDWCKCPEYYWEYVENDVYIPKRLGSMVYNKKMSTDASQGIYLGEGVPFLCIQMAYHMGFKEVYVVGMDCDHSGDRHFYTPDEREKKLKKKDKWDDVFSCYHTCSKVFQQNGRTLANAGVGGKLDVIPRVRLEDVV